MDEKPSLETNNDLQNFQSSQVVVSEQQPNPTIGSVNTVNNLSNGPFAQDNKSTLYHRKKLPVIIISIILLTCTGVFITLQFIKTKPKVAITVNSSSAKKSSSNKSIVSKNTVDSNTGVDTSGWQTVNNQTYNFSYKYPIDDNSHSWHLDAQNTSSIDGTFNSGVDIGSPGSQVENSIPVFGVSIYPPGSDGDQEYLSTLTPQSLQAEKAEYPSMTTSTATITKNGISGSCLITQYQKAEFNMPAGYRTNICRFIYKGKVYLLSAADYTLQTDADKFGKINGQPLSAVSQTMIDSFSFAK
ncbi:MAG TPA: hypothetical protein VH234_02090 [Candidatus Saccharimonadales bacterium]|jgi:hypothetical protein|nr:hypothetical protein [Candidatus Saccharimonadales bacterium]